MVSSLHCSAHKVYREIWENIFREEIEQKDNQSKPDKLDGSVELFAGTLGFGLIGFSFLILLIVFGVIGDTAQNLIMLAIMSGICILLFILYLVSLLSHKKSSNKIASSNS